MLLWIVLLSIFEINLAKDCGYPNGTETAMHFFNCDNSHMMTITNVALLDSNGNSEYPLNMKQPFTLKMSYAYSGQDVPSYTFDIEVSEFKTSLFSSTCKWHGIPTMGKTNNLNGCNYMCPIPGGDNVLVLNMDLSASAGIISTLVGKNDFQMVYRIKDPNKKELACWHTQLRAVVV